MVPYMTLELQNGRKLIEFNGRIGGIEVDNSEFKKTSGMSHLNFYHIPTFNEEYRNNY